MEYLQYQLEKDLSEGKIDIQVLNLIINGIPSILL